jgi:leucyl aminopeptidase
LGIQDRYGMGTLLGLGKASKHEPNFLKYKKNSRRN